MVMAGEDIRTFLRRMPRTVRVGVLPGGLSEFISIEAAKNYAVTQAPADGAEWEVQVWPGTYVEQVTGAPFVRIVAMGSREQCIISQPDADVVIGANNFSIEGFTLQITAPSAPRTCIACGATSPTIRRCSFVGAAAQPITAVSHTTGSPVVEDCETGANIAVLLYTNGAGTLTGRRITSTAAGAILTSAACGAAAVNIFDSNLGAGTITTTAGGTPLVHLDFVLTSGALNHNSASRVYSNHCYLGATVCGAGVAAWCSHAHGFIGGTVTNNGTGPVYLESCHTEGLFNNSTGVIRVDFTRVVGDITQAATAGIIYVDSGFCNALNCGAGGTIILYGLSCGFSDITLADGIIWWTESYEERAFRVVAGTINMKVADAIARATAGRRTTIKIGPGIFAESNLTAKNLVDLVGDDPENCQIVANDAANPIITVPNGVTCTIQGLRVENTNAGVGAGVKVTGGTPTIRNCFLKAAAAAGGQIGALDIRTTISNVTVQDSHIEGPAAIAVKDVANTLLCERSRINGASYALITGPGGQNATFVACDGLSTGLLYLAGGPTVTCKACVRWTSEIRLDSGTIYLDHCDCNSLRTDGVVVAIASSFTTIGPVGSPASLTMDDACSISGAITGVDPLAIFILPRKRLGVGLGAPGLLADATQMDSIVGAGAPINQAPATRTTTDWARTVKVVHTGVATAFPYTITLTGNDNLKGNLVAVTEVITVTGAGTFRGVKAWGNISNWTSSGNITAADTVALQMDSRLGLEHRLRGATHLLACRKSPGGAAPLYRTPGSFTLNLTNYTIEETGVPVVAGDNYEYLIVKG